MKKIKLTVKNIGESDTWEETYITDENPEDYADRVINHFNSTLREGEKPRELIGVMVISDVKPQGNHVWSKKNLVTVHRNGVMYDIMVCEKCGITGKRYGLSGDVIRDRAYKAKKYNTCNG